MNIAVLANYKSLDYQILLLKVKSLFPEDLVLDLSRHTGNDWKKSDLNRISDISNSSLVIVCQNWQAHVDVIHDLTEAQRGKKDIFIEFEGRFVPLTQQTARVW